MTHESTPIDIGSELTPRLQKITRQHLSDFREAFGGSTAHEDLSARPLQYGARTMYPFYAMLSERFPRAFARGGREPKTGSALPASVRSTSRMPTSAGRCGPQVPFNASASN